MRNQFIAQFVVLSLQRSTCRTARCLDGRALFCAPISLQSLAEIWPEGVRRVDLSKCRVIKWIVAPFHGNLPNLSNDPRIYIYIQSCIKIRINYFVFPYKCFRISFTCCCFCYKFSLQNVEAAFLLNNTKLSEE